MRLNDLGDTDIAEKRCRLTQRLLQRLGLCLRCLAREHGQVECLCLQMAVGVAAGEQLGKVLGLQRLGAVGDQAVIVVCLEQLRANLKLVCLLQRFAHLTDVRLARDVEQLLFDVHHLAIDKTCVISPSTRRASSCQDVFGCGVGTRCQKSSE
eukprot:4069758-Pleurochrysis_carterae.AAC.1